MEKHIYTQEEIQRSAREAAQRQFEGGVAYRFVGLTEMVGELTHREYVLFNTVVMQELSRLQEEKKAT